MVLNLVFGIDNGEPTLHINVCTWLLKDVGCGTCLAAKLWTCLEHSCSVEIHHPTVAMNCEP